MQKTGKKQKFGRHYIRYLISYMTVLLIPLVILTFFYSSRFMKKFYDEIYETVDLELLQISTQLDNEPVSYTHLFRFVRQQRFRKQQTVCQLDRAKDRRALPPRVNII